LVISLLLPQAHFLQYSEQNFDPENNVAQFSSILLNSQEVTYVWNNKDYRLYIGKEKVIRMDPSELYTPK